MAQKPKLATTPLAQAIQGLRSELAEAIELGKDQDLKFDVGNIELELGLVATQEGGAGGKISFSLFGLASEASLEGKLAREVTHRLKLNLTPKLHGMDDFLVPTVEDEIKGGYISTGGIVNSGRVTVMVPQDMKVSVENFNFNKKTIK